MSPEDFSNLASAIESIVVAIAVVVGGVWTLIRFSALGSIQKAKADLEATRRKLRERGIFNFTMEATQLTDNTTTDRQIVVSVRVQNDGNRSEVINWSVSFLRVTQMISSKEHEGLTYGHSIVLPYTTSDGPAIASSVMPGQARTFPFLAAVASPGIYQLQFVAKLSPAEASISEAEHLAAGVDSEEFIWQSVRYIMVA